MSWKQLKNGIVMLKYHFTNFFMEQIDMIYKIALHKSDEGVAVSVPGLPGCWSQGENEEEAIANIREAISDYLSVVDMQ